MGIYIYIISYVHTTELNDAKRSPTYIYIYICKHNIIPTYMSTYRGNVARAQYGPCVVVFYQRNLYTIRCDTYDDTMRYTTVRCDTLLYDTLRYDTDTIWIHCACPNCPRAVSTLSRSLSACVPILKHDLSSHVVEVSRISGQTQEGPAQRI